MPTFPRYESKQSLTTQQPSVLATPGTEGEILENKAKAAQAVSDTAAKWGEYLRLSQENIALANSETDLAQREQAGLGEPDPNKEQSHIDGLHAKRDELMKGLSPSSAAKVKLKYDVAEIKLRGEFKKKWVDINNVATDTQIDNIVNEASPFAKEKLDEVLALNPEYGYRNENNEIVLTEKGYKKQKEAEKNIKFNTFTRDLQIDPKGAEEKLKSNAYGFDISELEKARTIQDKTATRRQEIAQESRFNNATNTGVSLVNGTLTRDALSSLEDNGALDPEIAGAFEIALFSPKWKDFEALTENKVGMSAQYLMSLVDRMDKFNPNVGTSIIKDALNAYNSKPQKINENDLAWIIHTIDQKRQDQNNPLWSKLTSSVTWLAGLGVGDKATQLFMKLWDRKSDPMVTAKEAAQQASISESPKSVNYEVGKRYKHGVYLGINPETGKKMFQQ